MYSASRNLDYKLSAMRRSICCFSSLGSAKLKLMTSKGIFVSYILANAIGIKKEPDLAAWLFSIELTIRWYVLLHTAVSTIP